MPRGGQEFADLPILLPEDANLLEGGKSPLPELDAFARTTCPQCGEKMARRETDTMDTFVESSWYFERYCSPDYHDGMFDKKAVDYWMPVDTYTGGIEHATMHLIYTRFFHKACRDMGIVKGDETTIEELGLMMAGEEAQKVLGESEAVE